MAKYTIEFSSIPVSKKNSKKIVCRWRRPLVLPSEAYKKRHQENFTLVPDIDEPIDYPISMHFHFYVPFKKDWAPSKKTWDLDNKVNWPLDLMVDAWFLEDDNYTIVSKLSCTYEYVEYWKWKTIIYIDDL